MSKEPSCALLLVLINLSAPLTGIYTFFNTVPSPFSLVSVEKVLIGAPLIFLSLPRFFIKCLLLKSLPVSSRYLISDSSIASSLPKVLTVLDLKLLSSPSGLENKSSCLFKILPSLYSRIVSGTTSSALLNKVDLCNLPSL